MINIDALPPIKVYGPAILFLPIGFLIAKNRGDQLDAIYSVADDPSTTRERSEQLLRWVPRLLS
jgi:hypothetical protein